MNLDFSPRCRFTDFFEKVLEYILFDLGSALGRARVRSPDDAHEDKGPHD